MGMLRQPAELAPRLQLSRDLVRSIKRGHPWIYADALQATPEAPAGSHGVLYDKRGDRVVARGMYDHACPLAFRVCSTSSRRWLDDLWAEERLRSALALRRTVIPEGHTTGYRLLHGEGDGMPGLVVDVYGDTGVLVLDGDGPAGFWDAEGVAERVAGELGLARVYERDRVRGGPSGRPLVGDEPAGDVEFRENGILFACDVKVGQKTGFFLDQRDNRQRVRHMARGRNVLNVFGYTGGFSVYAGVGGAEHVTTVDIAEPAIEAAVENWRLNELPMGRHDPVAADAFEFLEGAAKKGRKWDLVILDPPSFAPNRRAVPSAEAAYQRLIAAGADVTASGGILCAASCSSHIDGARFLDLCEEGIGKARRRATVLDIHGQPPDHPSPLPMPQFRYLKFVVLRL